MHTYCRGDAARKVGASPGVAGSARVDGSERRPDDAAFTMIELVVSVGLMILLLGVLAFVFQQSANAVASSTEAVNAVQRARSFEARFGQDISRAVRTVLETETGRNVRTFQLAPDPLDSPPRNINLDGGDNIMFVSKTRYKGIEDTWVVRYYYEPARLGADYGAIKRMVRVDDSGGEPMPYDVGDPYIWDIEATEVYDPSSDPDMQVETISSPVQPMPDEPLFYVIDPDADLVDAGLAFRLPASVKVSLKFIDPRGAEGFEFPMQFHFPIYQGE